MKKTGTFTENQKLKKKKSIKKKKAGTNSDSSEELIQLLPLNIFQFHLDITVYAAKPKGNYIILEVGTLIYYQMKNNKREQ